MFSSILKFVAKSYLTLTGLIILSVLAVYIIFAGMIAFVNLIVPN